MGMNYFLRVPICHHEPQCACASYEEFHVGKKSMGWQFVFRAHDKIERKKADVISAVKPRSWAFWKHALRLGRIFNEIDEEIPREGFEQLVECSRGGKTAGDFFDADGWGFFEREFS